MSRESEATRVLTGKKIGFLGLGKIGEALALGLLERAGARREDMIGSVAHAESAERAARRTGIRTTTRNADVVAAAEILVLATKPQAVPAVLAEVGGAVRREQLFISVAASVPTSFIEARLAAPAPVVRVMPNTPCLLGAGMSVLARGSRAGEADLAAARAVFDAVGRTAVLDERLMDAVTGLSGSGPAYIYMAIEALSEAGVKLGIPREIATLLSAQTVHGAARMVLETKEHPALLKDVVTTPAGCTIDGLLELEEGKLRVTLVKAVVKAAERARQLVDEAR
jgi:pyrroline-5-carboxylate reductase